ncbi:hypothetical protein [Rhizobium sp. BK251]|uniref:hypothetical protein n=1 Tax=Rhizobium sp. BK251 TaxID=2512125 RepID=UPI00105409E7|nr:hypothetical protein [Rhizobium sp. BK251]TCL74746.1 hypothetical protein EV286_102307 [Rhizobium sp. BK251]
MFQTAFTLNLTQFARTLSLPERLQRTPGRNLALETLRLRNTALDAIYYDVKSITPEEAFYISDSLAAEGSIMIVPPTGAGPLTLCDTLEEFIVRGGQNVHVLAVAGVGSSALGAAAFARNVADAAGEPVAVVVSGYGFSDVVTEACGGNFLFGYLNGLRHTFELLDEFSGRPKLGAANYSNGGAVSRISLDTKTTKAILADPRLSFHLVVGHSKGNFVISEALYDLQKAERARVQVLAGMVKIVTFGGRIAMPPVFTDVIDVLGEWDWFGEINSRPSIATDRRVASAGHHTNTELVGHLPVTAVLREVLAEVAKTSEQVEANAVPALVEPPQSENAVGEKAPVGAAAKPKKKRAPRKAASVKASTAPIAIPRDVSPQSANVVSFAGAGPRKTH